MEQGQSRATTTPSRLGSRRFAALAVVLLGCGSADLIGQQAQIGPQASGFPEFASPVQAPAALPSGSLSGSVFDHDGAVVPGARVSLRNTAGGIERTVTSGAEGRFGFSNLPAGTYVITASAPGFGPFVSPGISLVQGESRTSLDLSLSIPAAHTDITVTVPSKELATEEIHEAEQQRIFGFPDFYTSFRWDAQPLDTGQKFSLALHATTDYMAFVTAAGVAGGEQIENTFPSYGGGAEGYAKRYGAAYADGFVGKIIGSAILPSVFRQDPRYFYMGPERGTVRQRARHAILSAVIARGDNGRPEPNYSHLFGNAAAGALSTYYHPSTDSAGKLALDNALLGSAGEAAVDLAREFLLRHFTRGVPAASSGN